MRCRLGLLCALGLTFSCQSYPYPGEEGVVLHYAINSYPKGIDPPQIEDTYSSMMAAQVFEGLYAYHPFARPYELMPAIAAEMPIESEDKLTYTIPIRRGVRFHDDPCFPNGKGRDVTAHDILYDFKRLAHPNVHSQGWWLFDGRIEGLNEWREALADEIAKKHAAGEETGPLHGLSRDVAGFQVVDDYTFQIKLTEPYPQLHWVLAMSYTSIYPKEAVDHYGTEMRTHAVGTGPFVLEEFDPVYRAVFRKNPHFRDIRVPDPRGNPDEQYPGWEQDDAEGYLKHAGERIPLVDGIELRFIIEDQPRWLYFRSGYTDFANPPKDNVGEALPNGELSDDMRARGVRVQPWTETGTVYLVFNTENPKIANVELRRAIALALDHRWMIDNLYGGQAILATSMMPPEIAGYDPDYHPYHADDGRPQLARAREHLAKAGYPDGIDPETGRPLQVTWETTGGVTGRQFGQQGVDNLRRIGITVHINSNTFPQLLQKFQTKQYEMGQLAWSFDYPDAQNILQLFYGPNAPRPNAANFKNEEFDALYEKAATLSAGPERTEVYERMAHIHADYVPAVPRTHRIVQVLKHEWLSGLKFTRVNSQWWRYAAIDVEAREQALAEWNQPVWWPCVSFLALFGAAIGFTIRRNRRRTR